MSKLAPPTMCNLNVNEFCRDSMTKLLLLIENMILTRKLDDVGLIFKAMYTYIKVKHYFNIS